VNPIEERVKSVGSLSIVAREGVAIGTHHNTDVRAYQRTRAALN